MKQLHPQAMHFRHPCSHDRYFLKRKHFSLWNFSSSRIKMLDCLWSKVIKLVQWSKSWIGFLKAGVGTEHKCFTIVLPPRNAHYMSTLIRETKEILQICSPSKTIYCLSFDKNKYCEIVSLLTWKCCIIYDQKLLNCYSCPNSLFPYSSWNRFWETIDLGWRTSSWVGAP